MLPTDTMLRAVIDDREQEIQGELRRSQLLGRTRGAADQRAAVSLRSRVSAVLRRHLVRNVRHAVAHSRR